MAPDPIILPDRMRLRKANGTRRGGLRCNPPLAELEAPRPTVDENLGRYSLPVLALM